MKSILLASASIVAFAGAAAAEVTFGGTAVLGYNDVIEDGFYVEGDLGVTFSQQLSNGLVAGATFGLNVFQGEEGEDDDFGDTGDLSSDNDFVLFLTDEAGTSGLFFGDTIYAAEKHWDSVGDMASDGFSEQDDETVLRGDAQFGDIGASVSYNIADAEGDSADDLDQLSVGASGSFNQFTFNMGYQEESDAANIAADTDDDGDVDEDDEDYSAPGIYDEDSDDDFNGDEIFAIAAGTTFAGADARVGYASNMTDETSSLGFEVGYPVGPAELNAFYVIESAENDDDVDNSYGVSVEYASGSLENVEVFYESIQGEEDFGFEATFRATPELAINGGYSDADGGFIAGIYGIDENATVTVSYAEEDEAGDAEYKEGTTVELALTF